ncbi:MAG: T9SS type A sorting domain-containing protein, partial [Marinoscillum sp.]
NSMVFPIGDNNDYSPFTFTLNSGTLASPTVSLRVVDAVHPNIYGSNYLSRYWELTESGSTSPDYNVSYVYKEADVVGTDEGLFAAKYSASDWTSGGSVNDDTNTVSWNNITSFSDFTGAQNSIILPIELRELNVKEDAHGVLISWSTYTETNNDYFSIERSRDGKATETIAEVTGSGTTKSARAYQTRDNSPLAGLSFYRLKQTDFDGQFSHSKWVSFENIDEDHVRFSIFPNPSSGKEIDLTFNYLTNVPLSIRITDLSGQTILQELFTPLEEHSKLRVRFVKKLNPGIYLIQLDGAEMSRVQKLIVQ